MKKYKIKALEILKQKINDEIIIAYKEISNINGYSKMQLNRFSIEVEIKDIDSLLVHGLTDKPYNNSTFLFFNLIIRITIRDNTSLPLVVT